MIYDFLNYLKYAIYDPQDDPQDAINLGVVLQRYRRDSCAFHTEAMTSIRLRCGPFGDDIILAYFVRVLLWCFGIVVSHFCVILLPFGIDNVLSVLLRRCCLSNHSMHNRSAHHLLSCSAANQCTNSVAKLWRMNDLACEYIRIEC